MGSARQGQHFLVVECIQEFLDGNIAFRKKSVLLLIITLIFLNSQLYSQSFDKIDSLANEMCETLILISVQSCWTKVKEGQ